MDTPLNELVRCVASPSPLVFADQFWEATSMFAEGTNAATLTIPVATNTTLLYVACASTSVDKSLLLEFPGALSSDIIATTPPFYDPYAGLTLDFNF